jgi:outer membrane protein insertion porin family
MSINNVAAAALAALAGAPALPARSQETPPSATAPGDGAVRRVLVAGVRSLPEADLAALAARAAAGRPAGPDAVRAAAEAVRAEYRRRGFPVAQVVSSEMEPDGVLRLTVAEGTVRRILIRGNAKTRASTVRAAMETRPGDVYREDRIAADRDRLARLGIFEDVVIAPTLDEPGGAGGDAANAAPPAADDTGGGDEIGAVDAVVSVKERRTGNLAATLGFGDRTGLVGYVDLAENNFGGRAQQVSVQWQRWTRTRLERNGVVTEEDARSAYRMSFFAPLLGARGRDAVGLDVYDTNTIFQPLFAGDDETLRSYEQRRGATLRVGRRLRGVGLIGGRGGGGAGLTLFLTARRDEVGYGRVPARLNPPVSELLTASGTVGALGAQLIADARDAAENPGRGYFVQLSHENAGSLLGGDRSFGQTRLDARRYLRLGGGRENGDGSGRETGSGGGPVLALRLLGGTSTGDVPLSEQFWIGGYELLRGYDLYSIRGDRMLLGSAEARFPISAGFQGAVFADYGNAWAPGERASLADLKAGVGVGLRFLTPIGPIRLDAAYGDGLKTYVSLGQAY